MAVVLDRAAIVELLTRASAAPDEREQAHQRIADAEPPVFAELVAIMEDGQESGDLVEDYMLIEEADRALSELVRARRSEFMDWASAHLDSAAVAWHLTSCDGTGVDDLLLDVLREGAPGRGHAATALGERRDRRALPLLVALLDDPDESFAAVKALHVLADQSTIERLMEFAERSRDRGQLGAEEVARDTVKRLRGQGRRADELRWFLVPHADGGDGRDAWSWRNAAVVAAFDSDDARVVIECTWARIETAQSVPTGSPRLRSGVELRDLRFPIRPGWPLRRGMAYPFSIVQDGPE